MDTTPWLDDWIHGEALSLPRQWARPGVALLFNLECPGCVSRAMPWFKRAARRVAESDSGRGSSVQLFAVHTAYGHRQLDRDAVVPQLQHYASQFAELPFPVALDLSGEWASAMGAEGTPHWFVWDASGGLERSVYGSQENALTRLAYLFEGWGVMLGD
jgi:hypothetical protein